MKDKELIELAMEASKKAYSPYSGYKVGAALLSKSGKVFLGCNVENASFSATNCAERTAIFKAVSEGENEFSAIAIVGSKDENFKDFFPPCGICRQVLREFCDDDFKIIIGKNSDDYLETTLKELLPMSFSKKNIEN